MKKRLIMVLMVLLLAFVMSACSSNDSTDSNNAANAGNPSAEGEDQPIVGADDEEQDAEESEVDVEREVVTYLDMTFDDVEEGADIPGTGGEGAGFSVVMQDGNGWAVSRNPQDWAAMYVGVPGPDGSEIFLEDYAVETRFTLPSDNDGISNDGGLALFVAQEGRYDVALAYSETGNAIVNVWKAGNTDGGPILTNNNQEFPDRGFVSDFQVELDKEYTLTLIGTYRKDEEENQFTHIRIYLDDTLVIESEIPFWHGGFGLRAWQSAIRYDYLKISDAPLYAPDGQEIVLNR